MVHPPHPNADRSAREAGFTLLEAMVVVAIIGITAAIAAPALSESMADRRAGEAAHSLVRLGARARSEAMAYGRAHLIIYADTSSGSTGNGSAQLWRGRVNLCSANQWNLIVTGTCATNVNCIDALDMGTFNHGTQQVRMRLPGMSAAFVCFQPDGELMVSAGAGAVFDSTAPAGTDGVLFTVDRLVSGSVSGVQRRVVFPFGGSPRMLR